MEGPEKRNLLPGEPRYDENGGDNKEKEPRYGINGEPVPESPLPRYGENGEDLKEMEQ